MKRGGAVPRMRPLPLAILWLLLLCTTSASSREFSKKQGNRNQAFSAAMNYAPSWASSSGMHTKEPGRPSYSLGAPVLRATMSAQRPVSPETVKKRISVCLRVLNNILPGYSSDQSAEVCARLASRSTTGTNNNNNNDNNNNKKTPDPSNGNKGTRRPKDYLFLQMEELERLVGKTRELEKSLLNNIAARRMLIAKSSKQGSANLPVLGLGKKPGSEKPKIISHGIRELEKNANVAFLESQLAAGTFNDLDFLDITKAVFATTQFTPKTKEWKPTSTKSRPETSSADEVEDIRLLAANHAKIDAIGLKIQKEILSATRYQVPPQDVSSSASSTFLQGLSSSSSNNSGYDGFVSTHDPALTFPTPPEFASKQPWSRHEGPPVSAENETLFDEALLHDLAETRQFRPDFQVGEFLTDAQRREEKLLEITNNGHDPYPESFLQKGSLANEYKLHAIHNTGIHPPSYIRKKGKKLFPESGNTEELYAPKRNSHRTNTQCSRKRSQALFKRDIQSVVMSDPVSGNLKAKDLPLVETPQNALPPQSAEKQPINSAEIRIPKVNEVLSSLQGPEKAMKLMREEQKDLVSKLQMLQLHQLGVMKKHKQLQHALTPSVRPTTKSMENDVFDRMAAITTQSQKNHSANHMKSTQRPSTTVSIKKSTPGAISNHSSNSHSMSSSKSRENILEENLIDIMKTRGKFWNSEDRDDVTSEELDKHVEIRDSCLGCTLVACNFRVPCFFESKRRSRSKPVMEENIFFSKSPRENLRKSQSSKTTNPSTKPFSSKSIHVTSPKKASMRKKRFKFRISIAQEKSDPTAIKKSISRQKRSPQNTIDPLIDAITDPKGSGVINSLEKEKLAEFQEAQRINNTVVELIMEEVLGTSYQSPEHHVSKKVLGNS